MKKEKIKKIVKISIIVIPLVLIPIIIAGSVYSEKVFTDISDNVVRLHVIANSDSADDQNLKLKVRDAIVEYAGEKLKDCNTKESVVDFLQKDCDNIKQLVEDCMQKEGSNYSAYVCLGEYNFPAKNYGNYCFPEGKYQALRVVIGEGIGKNWWCVLFPPLCYISENAINISSEAEGLLRGKLSDEAYETIEGKKNDSSLNNEKVKESSEIESNVTVSYKFKIVEFFQKIVSFFSD